MKANIVNLNGKYYLSGTIRDMAIMPLPFDTVEEARAYAWHVYEYMK